MGGGGGGGGGGGHKPNKKYHGKKHFLKSADNLKECSVEPADFVVLSFFFENLPATSLRNAVIRKKKKKKNRFILSIFVFYLLEESR